MSRKNKIIVSVVGIMIVLLALLGITYAYYLTRIQGNTNTNSISITTANLLLKYDDGSGAIVEENIMPGATFTKTFSVTNEGNAKIDNYVVYLEEVVNDLKRPQDLTYTLTCDNCAGSSGVYPKLAGIIATNSIEVGVTHNYTLTVTYENLPNTDQSIDMGSRISGYIQIYNLQDIVDLTGSVTNAVDGDYVQINSVQKISQIVDGKYTLGAVEPGSHTITVRYLDENDEEQIRSTKTITIQKGDTAGVVDDVITVTNDSQTVNINIDATNAENTTINNTIKDYNPFNEGTLAHDIYKNALNVTNEQMATGIAKLSNPLTKPGKEISKNTEAVLARTIDNYTASTGRESYYFRGNVTNNYVNYSGMCWRIVRIDSKNNIKLVLADENNLCSSTNYLTTNDSSAFVNNATDYSYKNNGMNLNDVDYSLSDIHLTILPQWVSSKITDTTDLELNDWCIDMSISDYKESDGTTDDITTFSSKTRIDDLDTSSPSMECNFSGLDDSVSKTLSSVIGILTADEVAFAGGASGVRNNAYYLYHNALQAYYTMSPYTYSNRMVYPSVYSVGVGTLDGSCVWCGGNYGGLAKVRPSVVLKKSVQFSFLENASGDKGTRSNPYVIN